MDNHEGCHSTESNGHNHGTDGRTDIVRKRIRDGESIRSKTAGKETHSGGIRPDRDPVSLVENFDDSFHEIENSETKEKNKTIRTESAFHESLKQPSPAYFLASNLLPSNSKRIIPQRSVGNSLEVEKKEKSLENEKNNKSNIKNINVRDLELKNPHLFGEKIVDSSQNGDYISSNSSPLHRMGRKIYQSSISYDSRLIQSDDDCTSKSIFSSSSNMVSSQLIRNVTDKDNVTNLILGLNRNKLQTQTQSLPLHPLLSYPSSSPVFFSPLGSLSSKLLPPPL